MEITNITFDNRDEYNRQPIAEKVINLLSNDIDISPLVINGDWGTGKTEFCHKLVNMFREVNTHHVVYIDAFKADHANEPLLTVLAEIVKILPDNDQKSSLKRKIIPALKFGIKTISKAAVAHVLRQDATEALDQFDQELQEIADKSIDATAKALFNEHLESEKNIKALQEILSGIAEEKPMAIFIDELDRCRPNFAVDILELIKHTFDLDNVNFILVTNFEQLKASINHSYGQSINANRYLDKFIKFTISLPKYIEDQNRESAAVSSKHFLGLINNSTVLSNSRLNLEGFQYFSNHIFQAHDATLREVETFIRNLEIYQVLNDNRAFTSTTGYGSALLRGLAVAIHTFNPILASSILDDKLDARDLAEFLAISRDILLNSRESRPEDYEIIYAYLAKDCRFNAHHLLSAQEQQGWNELFLQVFQGGSYILPTFNRTSSLKSVLQTLNLG
ncbi:KAP family P-loop NTPase fold protein [Pleionea litopenaei]|uniref:P-loop NTPase fold protein n=1 Tax=Pleionea litopenaei TaxID=3070815 RepID=A0AA51X5Y8_9GAMM|nr:P-loop NTPase fold protein [Pleionea sp. HL-JVS1]WMS86707.1 P-loop NTPase fold protein [Pleionea sp. HL-JVS1]